jgi:GNAT superfamily N-acetyltransferase
MVDASIVELETEEEWLQGLPVLKQLRTHLTESSLLKYRTEMQVEGYRLFAATADDEIVSLAGVIIQTNFYDGRHVYVYDLITDAEHRSQGYGLHLLEFVTEWGRENDCETVTLASGLQRADAHRFYEERAGMDRSDYVFKKSIG